MMRQVYYTKTFEKDVQRMKKRGKDLKKLKEIITLLIEGKTLGIRYKDHKLQGNFRGHRDCHIEADWVLIYKLDKTEIIFERTGTHADLFI